MKFSWRSGLKLALAYSMTTTVLASAAWSAPPVKKPDCGPNREFSVADLSDRTHKLVEKNGTPGLQALQDYGIKTIFRYYDFKNESKKCKTLQPKETDALLAKGFRIGVVFQHESSDPKTFIIDSEIGRKHALRSLELAAANGQPKDSAIYFGVDGADLHLRDAAILYRRRNGTDLTPAEAAAMDPGHVKWYRNFRSYRNAHFRPDEPITAESLNPFIKTYFEKITAAFKEHARQNPEQSYKIGIYCTAAMCDFALRNTLAEFFWVTAEGRLDASYAGFVDQNRWHLLQQQETKCPKWETVTGLDFNRTSQRGIGDWNTTGKRTPIDPPVTCSGD